MAYTDPTPVTIILSIYDTRASTWNLVPNLTNIIESDFNRIRLYIELENSLIY